MTLKKLNLSDIISLSIFAAIIAIGYSLNFISLSKHNDIDMNKSLYEMLIDFFAIFFVAGSPFCIRFRNIYFSIPWVVLSCFYILQDKRPLTFTPLSLFLLYHLVRLFYHIIYKREFIPCSIGRGKSIPYFSTLDNKWSEKTDSVFMWIYFFLGLFSFFLLIVFFGDKTQ